MARILKNIKKFSKILLLSGVIMSANADVEVYNGWNLLGNASKEINVQELLNNNSEIINLWVFYGNIWSQSNQSLDNIGEINTEQGFWLQASQGFTLKTDDKTITCEPTTTIKGVDGESVKIRYSNDNSSSSWQENYTSSIKYISFKESDKSWTNGIKIVGEDGKNISLQNVNNTIQWKREGDSSWQNLITIDTSSETTSSSDSSSDSDVTSVSQPVSLRVDSNYIQWQKDGASSWNNLISLDDLKGLKGDDGINGKSVELQNDGTNLQWKQENGNWLNLVALSDLTPTSSNSESSSNVLVIDSTNFESVTIPEDVTTIKINGTITLTSTYKKLDDLDGVTIIGGTLEGNGGDETSYYAKFGNDVVFRGVTFSNIRIYGPSQAKFENCSFNNNIHLPWEFIADNSSFNSVNLHFNSKFRTISNSEISNSTLPRGINMINSVVNDSTFGNDEETNGHSIQNLLNNSIDNTTINVHGSNRVIGNAIEDSYLEVFAKYQIQISNNNFHKAKSVTGEVIFVNTSSSSWKELTISNNNFIADSSASSSILISGISTSSYSFVNIDGNSFLKGTYAISFLGNTKTVIQNNVVKQTDLGVDDNGDYNRVQNNIGF